MFSVESINKVKSGIYINGRWIHHDEYFTVYNPTNMNAISKVTNANLDHAKEAIISAVNAFSVWSQKTPFERSRYLRNYYELILAHKYELAEIIHLEQGKSLKEALGEVEKAGEYVLWFSEECKRIKGDLLPSLNLNQTILVEKEPIGVVTAITPWNQPVGMVLRKIAPALAAGCVVIVKPSHETPLSCIRLIELFDKADFPYGVINLITTTDENEVGSLLTSHPAIKAVTFTGSSKTGNLIMKNASSKKLIMELGGHAPFIAFEDCNIDNTVESLIKAKFRTAGQTCVSVNMLFIESTIYKDFLRTLLKKLHQLNGNSDFNIPLINQSAVKKVKDHVIDALDKGASIIYGESSLKNDNLFINPIVLSDITPEMKVTFEETFGPVLPVISFKSIDDIMKLVNLNEYGLAAYIFTEDIGKALKLQKEFKFGVIGINESRPTAVHVPFGGFNKSGVGKEGGQLGIEEFLINKSIYINYN